MQNYHWSFNGGTKDIGIKWSPDAIQTAKCVLSWSREFPIFSNTAEKLNKKTENQQLILKNNGLLLTLIRAVCFKCREIRMYR